MWLALAALLLGLGTPLAGCRRTGGDPPAAPSPAPAWLDAATAPTRPAAPRALRAPAPSPNPRRAGAATARPAPPHVLLVPLGRIRGRLLAAVSTGLRRELGVTVERHPRMRLPRSAYYPRRRRYRADRLLTFLRQRFTARPASTRVLGLTAVDISTTKGGYADWGVFGLGDLGGRACVISTFRLKRRARNRRHLRFRVVTTAIHEVGHTLGLDHCQEPRCVMLDAHGSIANTDTSTGRLGPRCRARLATGPAPAH